MKTFAPLNYGPAFAAVLTGDGLNALGPGSPRRENWRGLQALTLAHAFSGQQLHDESAGYACIAGAWLWNDGLDESHRISQDLASSEGSFWHGILHRREPDASNASYWFRRVGNHPIFPLLAEDAQELGLRLPSGRWDPFQFIDLCERHRDTGTEMEMLLCRVQQREWEHLFAWCYTHSVAGG